MTEARVIGVKTSKANPDNEDFTLLFRVSRTEEPELFDLLMDSLKEDSLVSVKFKEAK